MVCCDTSRISIIKFCTEDNSSISFNALGVAARQSDEGFLVAGADNLFVNAVPLFDAGLRNRFNVDFSNFPGAILSDANSTDWYIADLHVRA